ncbi:MAG: hypothetical protein J5808_01715 [Paludibacteraceae bacterium]|nr:hypothetical protein [Paludibacteraceae bacterium]
MFKRIVVLAVLPLFLGVAAAQECSVSAMIEPGEIRVGEQATLNFVLIQPDNQQFVLPDFTDSVCAGVELVKAPVLDTLRLKDNRIQVNINYLVTSFDSGFIFIPSQRFVSEMAVVESMPLGLTVSTVPVDVEAQQIYPEKDIMKAPFSWVEFFQWVGIVLGALLLVALIVFLIMRYGLKKKIPFLPDHEEPETPPYEVAMERLAVIREQKRWQTGEVKEFYTDVTDVLRTYFSKRFEINAMESTTEEILADVKKIDEMADYRAELKQVLEQADLVKFAKHIPMESEHYAAIDSAYHIVEGTKPVEETPVEGADNQQTDIKEQTL